ncbi:MAG TPA: hypothetical protein VGM81_20860 [Burkholderiaceae bacterium]|jgi:hypothetical protein
MLHLISFLILIKIELQREYFKFKRSLIGAAIGTIFLLIVYWLFWISSSSVFFTKSAATTGGAWIFLAWSFCVGTSTQLARNLTNDVSRGTLIRIQQCPAGICAVLRARFVATAAISILSMAPLVAGLILLFDAPLDINIAGVAILAIFMLQCYLLSLLLASVVFVARSEGAAQLAVFILGYGATFIPVGSLLGDWAWIAPWSGMLTMLRSGELQQLQLVGSVAETLVLIAIANHLVFRALNHLRHNGTLAQN